MPSVLAPEERSVLGYLAREFDDLTRRPLADVDSLALACLSYLRLPEAARAARSRDGMPLTELLRADWIAEMTRGLWDPDGLASLLVCACASPRLRDVRVSAYVDEFDERAEKQFSACTLLLPTGDAYVSFRGTDNTLVGWREDFNMAFEKDVPSQRAAVSYLERVAAFVPGRLYVGGHSKGGNLAVYATCRCSEEVAGRIERAFSHDGPGFTRETLSASGWRDRARLVSKTVPRSSLVGMLFEQQEAYEVVDSSVMGLAQHDPFSWVVEGADFVRVEEVGRGAGFVDDTLNQWISSMTHEEREGFVDALFSVLSAGGEDTFAGLSGNWQSTVPAMAERLGALEPERRAHVMRALGLLVRAVVPELELPRPSGFQPPQFPDLEALLPGRMERTNTSGEAGV